MISVFLKGCMVLFWYAHFVTYLLTLTDFKKLMLLLGELKRVYLSNLSLTDFKKLMLLLGELKRVYLSNLSKQKLGLAKRERYQSLTI
jgi:hypothetical protein